MINKNKTMKKVSNKNAFTLIELLSVIIILAIIALIAIPTIMGIIDSSKKATFEQTAHGMAKAGEIYYSNSLINRNITLPKTFVESNFSELDIKGAIPKGTLIINEKGKIQMAIHDGQWCALKEFNDSKIELIEYEEEKCRLDQSTLVDYLEKSSDLIEDDFSNKRYRGTAAKNYVKYNDELWRIIGLFNVENEAGKLERRIKIVRNDSIGSYVFDTSSITENSGYGFNNWENSEIKKLLNEGLYWNRSSGVCYIGDNMETENCDFTNNGLNQLAKSQISSVKWNLGGFNSDVDTSPFRVGGLTLQQLYSQERGNATYSGNDSTWIGNVGLMYSTDYIYSVDSECYRDTQSGLLLDQCDDGNKTWMVNGEYKRLITTSIDSRDFGFLLGQNGGISGCHNCGSASYGSVSNTNIYGATIGTYPVVYLNHDVKFIKGTGTSSDPYIIK